MPAVYSLVLALVVLGPLLGNGYLLLRDAVSTPRSYLTDSALGLGDAAPRAVPQDWLLAVLSPVVDGGVVVKVILAGALWAAGCGAAALARRLLGGGLAPQLVAATVAVWNPYVAERLLQGHWSLLAGYAALPWTALAAQRIRIAPESRLERVASAGTPAPGATASGRQAGRTRRVPEADAAPPKTAAPDYGSRRRRIGPMLPGWLALGGTLAAAGLTPTGAVLAGCVAVLLVGRRNVLGTLGLWCLASAPWLVAVALSGAGVEPSDPAGIAAFAARAEPGLGTIGSLAGLGGIWNAQAVPGSRTTLFALAGTVVLLAVVALGVRRVAARGNPHDEGEPPHDAEPPDAMTLHARRTLLLIAGVAIVLPALGATGWGIHLGEVLVAHVPGAGLLRDTQKYVALAMPAFALCAAAGCRSVAALGHRNLATDNFGETPTAADRTDGTTDDYGPISDPRPDRSGPIVAEEPTGQRRPAAAERPGTHRPGDDPGTEGPDHERLQGIPFAAEQRPENSAGPFGAERPPGRGGPSDNAEPRPEWSAAARQRHSAREATNGTALTAAVFIALLIAVLPDLAWGVGGALRPVHYPAGWGRVAARMDGPGDVAVLPSGMFREFPYSGRVPVLDPAPRMLPNDVLQTGELPVRGGVVAGEGSRAHAVERLLLGGAAPSRLAARGVGWILVEHRTPGPLGDSKTTLAQLNTVYSDRDLTLYRLPDPADLHTPSHAVDRRIATAAHVVWALLLAVGSAAWAARVCRRHTATGPAR